MRVCVVEFNLIYFVVIDGIKVVNFVDKMHVFEGYWLY